MERNNFEDENLNDEIDYDFFDDRNSEFSNSNNNAVIKSSNKKEESPSTYVIKNADEKPKSDLSNKSISQRKYTDDDTFLDASSHSSSSTSSKSSESNSNYSKSNTSSKSNSHKSSHISSVSSNKPSNDNILESSLRGSSEDSDVTSVSSLESDMSVVLEVPQKSKDLSHSSLQHSKLHTHFQPNDDDDMISTQVILQAMMRIHEERRLVQKLKPKWVDPNTKDYSISGITTKLNLVPDRIVSMPKKNIRSNPFYSHNAEIEKRLYHTAINRNKERDRIERENKAIVTRLSRIRPSPGITKDELLREYSKLNRFSNQSQYKSSVPSMASTCRPHSSSNSNTSFTKMRRTNSSTIISRFADSLQSHSRHSESKRTMSANSLSSQATRASSHSNSAKKRNGIIQ